MLKRFCLLAVCVLIACDNGTEPDDDDPSITLSAEDVNLTVGGTSTVTATIANVTSTPVFVTRNTLVASVNAGGTITGVGLGATYVVASVAAMPAVRDSILVVVSQVSTGPITLPLLGTGLVPERWTGEVAAAGGYAYTTTWSVRTVNGVQSRGNAIKIWNVNGNVPTLVDSIINVGVGTTSDVQISDDGSLLVVSTEAGGSANNGLFIYDRETDTGRLTQIRKYTSTNTAPGVHTVKLSRVNNRLYAFLNIDPPARLVILDITNPANPTEVFVQAMGNPFIHDVFVRDGVLFTALWDDGMRIFDIGGAGRGGTPAAPVALGTVRTVHCTICFPGTSSVHNIWWFNDPNNGQKRYAFIGEEGPGSPGSQSSSGALHVVDVSNFDNPVEVAIYEPTSETTANGQNAGAHNFVMDEASGILYAAFYNGGVRALDVRGDLGTCTEAQKTRNLCDLLKMGREVGVAVNTGPPKHIWGVARVGTSLYASDMWNGIHKIDISALQR
jgi:hypothetical protein